MQWQPVEEFVEQRWERLEDPAAYASTVMTRLNIGRIRRLRSELGLRQRLAPVAPVPPPTDGPEAWVVEALQTLSPHQRTALALRYLDDLDIAEIARQLRCRPGTAVSHLSRGLARLRAAVPPDTARRSHAPQ